jgi:hypothetical protein
MKFAVWAYPWDLLDEGVENVAERLAAAGIDEINLATNYHAVQAFLPHNPERRTFFAHASSYFQPGDGYGRLRPVPNEHLDGDDWVGEIADRLAGTPVSLNSWTIGCHNSRLGMANPDLTLTTAHGDSLAFGLCPSQPEVREYLVALLADLDDSGAFERIELESFDYFYGTGFGWHHQKIHTRLGPLGEFLFGLCFCDACRRTADDAGIDVEGARSTCRETIDVVAEGELSHETDPEGWLGDHPAVRDYVAVRTGTLTDLFERFREVVGSTDLGYYVGLLDVERSWMHGVDLESLADPLSYYTVVAYESDREAALDRLRTADARAPGIPLHAGVMPSHPAIYDEETLEDLVAGLVEGGAERISFYNYGLMPERNLEWTCAVARRHS